MPKVIRPKKQRTGLPSGTRDAASFDHDVLFRIHGEFVECFATPHVLYSEYHHCLSRGLEFGAKKIHPLRYIFSSPLNAIPLSRTAHDAPNINDYDLRCLFLDRAMAKVMNSDYEWQEKDYLFDRLVGLWRTNPSSHKLLTQLL